MGAFYSYFYYYNNNNENENNSDKGVQGKEETHRQCSDPSYTILYPPHEKDFMKRVEEEEEARNQEKKEEDSNNALAKELWDNMSQSERKKYKNKQRVKMNKKKKKDNIKREALLSKRNELQSWLDALTVKQRSSIKEVMWRVPEDESLHAYLRRKKDILVQCPNRFCGLYFERVNVDSKQKAPLVLGEDGKPLTVEALDNFLDNRFKCRDCETIFCVSCNAIPYHLGETCDQYKIRTAHPPCRVCKKPLPPPPDAAAKPDTICTSVDCNNLVHNLCTTPVATCKHPCNGIKNQTCLCLRDTCAEVAKISQRGSDFCNICWTDELEVGACIVLKCGHIFHRYCLEKKLEHKWTGARISFNFAACPLCQKPIDTTSDYSINRLISAANDLRKEIKIKAMHFLKAEGMLADIQNPDHKFHGKPVDYAIDVFSFYMCHTCKSPYYGGKRQCGDILNFNPEELVCGGCSGLLSCEKHGKKYIHYKCRFCCSIASWFCFGRVHYCENCHNNPYQYWASNNVLVEVPPQCSGKEKCPLGLDHPPNGFEEMSLGCSRCVLEAAGMVLEEEKESGDMDEDDDFY